MKNNYYKFRQDIKVNFSNVCINDFSTLLKENKPFSGVVESKYGKEYYSKRTYIKGYPYGLNIFINKRQRSLYSLDFTKSNGYALEYENNDRTSFEVYDMGFLLEKITCVEGKIIEKEITEIDIIETVKEFNIKDLLEEISVKYEIEVDDIDSMLGWGLSTYKSVKYDYKFLKKQYWNYYHKTNKEMGLYKNNDFIKYYTEQNKLKDQIIKGDVLPEKIQYVAGVDVAYNEQEQIMVGAIVVLNAETLEVVEQSSHVMDITFPYIPGLFSFREVPAILEAFKKLTMQPDLIICDAQGIAHPKNVGMATHLGIELDIPTIGCAKKRLVGFYEKEKLGSNRADTQELIWNSETVGVALRTQDNIKPMFVSIGHKISLETAIEWVLKVSPKYRLPETTRQADQLVNSILKETTDYDFLDDNKV
ncbi:deoxyribonuclease V [Pseudofulvibacter geojedonensis]|uniref:Endonuclease V n=1 Tax=Pseudofulvibacter geojedonensis TaxID=1123758 RepID=A0ABW3I0R4_9FLAO